jgi:CheY-specific phosphatase CheX
MSVPLSSDVVRRFLEVVVRQLRATVGVDAVVAAMGDTVDAAAIAVAVDFSGDVRGPVTWVFPQAIALELVRRLMADPDPDPETASDGATELANILTGHASAALEAHGFHCAFGVPRLHIGALPGGISVRMQTPAGPIDLVLSMSTATTRQLRVITGAG